MRGMAFMHAIEACGGRAGVKACLGISDRTYYNWLHGRVPLHQWLFISDRTGVPLHVLCPAVWPPPADSATRQRLNPPPVLNQRQFAAEFREPAE